MIILSAVRKMTETSPLCQHFLETRKNAEQRSAMAWLATCDLDTLHLINQTITKLANECASENTSTENISPDIFDETEPVQSNFDLNISSENDDEIEETTTESIDEATEVMCLTSLLLFWERHIVELEEEMVVDASDELAAMSIIETLRREGLVTISGSGKFFDPNNMANPVKDAKKKAKAVLKKKSAK